MDQLTLVGLGLLVPVRMRRQFSDAPTRPNHRAERRRSPTPASISLQLLSEGELADEPNVRLACTEEVENP